MNHDAARARAANEAYPDDGKGTWEPSVRPVTVTVVKPEPGWTVEKCAEILGVEPFAGEDWREHAVCRGAQTALFFPETGERVAPIVQLCVDCPVRSACLAYALNTSTGFGVWGGVAERQRMNMRNGRGFTVATAEGPKLMKPATAKRGKPSVARCGTPQGYDHHKRIGETPCAACLSAHSRQANEYRKAKKRRERAQ